MREYDFVGWCVLRCSPRHTLKLADTLGADGYEVWTPTETRVVRIPRANVKREVRTSIMPSYIFAKAGHLIDLIQLADMPLKPRRGVGLADPAHEDFRVMRCFGKIPLVTDSDLGALRRLESKLTPKKKAERVMAAGSTVRVEGGVCGGMTGVVERSDRSYTLVCLHDKYLVKIPTCLLNESRVRGEQIGGDFVPAAQAA